MTIGRHEEREALDAVIVGAAVGRGGTLAIVGEAGIGKTRLVEWAAERAAALAMAVMVGRATSQRVPLRPIVEMLLDGTRDVPRPTGSPDLLPFLPIVGALIPHWLPDGEVASSQHPLVLAEGVLRTAVHLAGDRGALLVVEDLHWIDDRTADVISFLCRRVDQTRVAVVLTARDDEPGTVVIPPETSTLRLQETGPERQSSPCHWPKVATSIGPWPLVSSWPGPASSRRTGTQRRRISPPLPGRPRSTIARRPKRRCSKPGSHSV